MGLLGEDRKFFRDKFNALNGAYKQLYDYDTGNAHQTGVANVTRGIHEGVIAALGKDVAEDLVKANHPTWDAYLADVGDRYAKKNGYVSKKDVDAAVTEGQKRALGKLATAMKERGIDIAQFTGNANPSVPAIRGGGGGSVSSLAQYNSATMEQRAAWDKADPGLMGRLIERETQQRG